MSSAENLKGKTGLRRVYNATIYSAQGLGAAFKNEAAFRQEVMLAMVMIPLAIWLDVSMLERIVLVASVVFVLIVELLNTAVEAVVDRIGSELHQLSGRAKDVGSAAVLISILLMVFVWGSILIPKFV